MFVNLYEIKKYYARTIFLPLLMSVFISLSSLKYIIMNDDFLDSCKFIFTYGIFYPICFIVMKTTLCYLLCPIWWHFIVNILEFLDTALDINQITIKLTIFLSNLGLKKYVSSLLDAVALYAGSFIKTLTEFLSKVILETLESSICNAGGMNHDNHLRMNEGTVEREDLGINNNNSSTSNRQNDITAGQQMTQNISDSDTVIQTGQNDDTFRRQVTDMNRNSDASDSQNNVTVGRQIANGIPDAGINLQIRHNEGTFRREIPDESGLSISDTRQVGQSSGNVRRQVATTSRERNSPMTGEIQDAVARQGTTMYPEECLRRLRSGTIYDIRSIRPIYVSRADSTRNAPNHDQASYSLIRAPSCPRFDWYGENLSRGQATFSPHTDRYEKPAHQVRSYTFN